MQQHDLGQAYKMGIVVDSGWLEECEVRIDHYSREIHCDILLGSNGYNVVFKPVVFTTGDNGEQIDAGSEILEIKYFLDGIEYDTLAVGGPGEFYFYDLGYGGKVITISVKLVSGVVLNYTVTYVFTVVEL